VTNPERARIRRDYVLQRMRELGFIGRAEETASQAVPMHATPHEVPTEVDAPYVAEMVRREMIDRFGEDVQTRGYRVTTTIDARLQDAARQAVRDGLIDYDHRHGWRKPEHLDLAPGEDAATAARRLDGIVTQGRLVPAIVLATGKGTAEVVLPDGSTLTLDAASSKWTGRSPSALLDRGDLVRVRRLEPANADKEAEAGGPRYALAQVPLAQSALVSLDPDDGALRALIGGFSFAANKFNRATQARRQPGSSFKPFLYAAAMERGFNPASIVLDAPVVFRDRAGNVWRPQNDDGKFRGPMRLREALVQSRNLVSVRLLDAIGIDYARRYIGHFGIDEDLIPPNLSMSLGTASLPPLMIARGYAVFTNGGFRITPYYIDTVRDRDGEVVFQEKPPTACPACAVGNSGAGTVKAANVVAGFNFGPEQAAPVGPDQPKEGAKTEAAPERLPADTVLAPRAIDARVAYQLVSMMRDVVQRGTGVRAKVLGREDVAGKTGSTNEYRDAWFSGFADDIVTTVWVGRDDFKSLGRGEYGGRAALPIWIDYMRVAIDGHPVAANEPPDGMVQVSVGPGGRLLPEGGSGIVEWVKAEDMERLQADPMEYDDAAREQEEAFDIF
jgi:penicillin-binding protein 1A